MLASGKKVICGEKKERSIMYQYKYPHPSVTADCLVFASDSNKEESILLVERKNPPFVGCWAFPGGFVNIDETAEDAAVRELLEETGLSLSTSHLTQIGAFTKVDRDPRERVISIAFFASLNHQVLVKGGDDAQAARWFPLKSLPKLAFDHAEILTKALKMREIII